MDINKRGFKKRVVKKFRFEKKKRSPINLGMIVASPKKNKKAIASQYRHSSVTKNKKQVNTINLNTRLNDGGSVQHLKIRSPRTQRQSSIKKYINVTKKLEYKTHERFNSKVKTTSNRINDIKSTKVDEAVGTVNVVSNFNTLKFKFCKNLYEDNLDTYFDYNVLNTVIDKLPHYKNLPIEDKYVCAIISNNIVILDN